VSCEWGRGAGFATSPDPSQPNSHAGLVNWPGSSLVGQIGVLPASSGNTLRHRLNRGGDRRLNRALTRIVLVRMRTDALTRAYVARRRQEGRTTKEIMRSLKRYITRQLFRTLAAPYRVPATP
jgi:Transposase IS116/IS110/IS902 family